MNEQEMNTTKMNTETQPKQPPTILRKGARDGVRTELSVFVKVKPGREKQIRAVLSNLSGEAESLAREAVVKVGSLHVRPPVLHGYQKPSTTRNKHDATNAHAQ